MFTKSSLISMHDGTQQSLSQFLDHCEGFSSELLSKEHRGFGYGSVLLQLHHAVGAERYWIGVLRGLMLVDENESDHQSIEALRLFRKTVMEATKSHLESTSDEELNTEQLRTNWRKEEVEVIPARVLLRTQTHIHHHLGQVAVMCRLLERPAPPGFDFPIALDFN